MSTDGRNTNTVGPPIRHERASRVMYPAHTAPIQMRIGRRERATTADGTSPSAVTAIQTATYCAPLHLLCTYGSPALHRRKLRIARFQPFLVIENRPASLFRCRDDITLCMRTNQTSDILARQSFAATRGNDAGRCAKTFRRAAVSIAWTNTSVGEARPPVSIVGANRSAARSVNSESLLAAGVMRSDAACRHTASIDNRLLEHRAASRRPGSISAATASSQRGSDHDCHITAYSDPARRTASGRARGRFDQDRSQLDQGPRASYSSAGLAPSGVGRGPRRVLESAPRVMSLESTKGLLWLFKFMSEAIL